MAKWYIFLFECSVLAFFGILSHDLLEGSISCMMQNQKLHTVTTKLLTEKSQVPQQLAFIHYFTFFFFCVCVNIFLLLKLWIFENWKDHVLGFPDFWLSKQDFVDYDNLTTKDIMEVLWIMCSISSLRIMKSIPMKITRIRPRKQVGWCSYEFLWSFVHLKVGHQSQVFRF